MATVRLKSRRSGEDLRNHPMVAATEIELLRADVERLKAKALLSPYHQRLYRHAHRLLKQKVAAQASA